MTLPTMLAPSTFTRLDIPQGQLALLPLQQLTRHGFGGPIEVSVVGPAGLSGTVTVPENAQSPPAAAGQPEPPAAALLPVRAAVDLAPGPYEIKVRARAMIDGKEFVTFASTRPAVSRDLGNLAVPPRICIFFKLRQMVIDGWVRFTKNFLRFSFAAGRAPAIVPHGQAGIKASYRYCRVVQRFTRDAASAP